MDPEKEFMQRYLERADPDIACGSELRVRGAEVGTAGSMGVVPR